ncbi:hypothetical protein CW368_11825 [Actinomycetales bacterium SN12]|nr:hypothetical protein CW368_11825 [Actinomycetales bacterium SN12]
MGKKEDIIAAAKALVFAAGMASAVGGADVQSAAATIARNYGETSARQIEAEIREHIRKGA